MICDECGMVYEVVKKLSKYNLCSSCHKIMLKKNSHFLRCKRKGISTFDFNSLLEIQNNKCACCDEIFISFNDIIIEHSHSSRKIRGLCCKSCNALIGSYKENIKLIIKKINSLNKIINYLVKHNAKDSMNEFDTEKKQINSERI